MKIIIAGHGHDSRLASAIGKDFKGKLSLAAYSAAIATAFLQPWISCIIYTLVAVMWFVPDQRLERVI